MMPKIEISGAILSITGIAVVIGIFLFVLNGMSNARKEDIYNTYGSETQNYISENKEPLIKLFTQMFPNQICHDSDPVKCAQPNPTGDEIAGMLTQNIKDWSSISFIKLANGEVLEMKLSGDVSGFYPYPADKKQKVVDLLNGKQDKIPWDEYGGYGQKQVIVPVKDASGHVVGAIVRGVIEK